MPPQCNDRDAFDFNFDFDLSLFFQFRGSVHVGAPVEFRVLLALDPRDLLVRALCENTNTRHSFCQEPVLACVSRACLGKSLSWREPVLARACLGESLSWQKPVVARGGGRRGRVFLTCTLHSWTLFSQKPDHRASQPAKMTHTDANSSEKRREEKTTLVSCECFSCPSCCSSRPWLPVLVKCALACSTQRGEAAALCLTAVVVQRRPHRAQRSSDDNRPCSPAAPSAYPTTRQDKTRGYKTRQDQTRGYKTRQDKTRGYKTGQDKTRGKERGETRRGASVAIHGQGMHTSSHTHTRERTVRHTPCVRTCHVSE
eukprot:COSAG06_NODE_8671_length_2070_cov_1.046953_4_plen_314_part_00